jgi:hypothetical protein
LGPTPNVGMSMNVENVLRLKSLALKDIRHEHEFISSESFHLTSQFCKIKLDLTQNSKIVSKVCPRSVGPPTTSFLYWTTKVII